MTAKKEATLKDLAKALDLSIATVSRALKDNPRINSDTKRRVAAAAKELGYVPNAGGNLIRGGRSALVGFVIPDIKNEFYASMASIVAARLASKGLQMVLAITHDDPMVELEHVRAMRQSRIAAIAVSGSARPHPETLQLLSQVPTVQLVRTLNGSSGNVMVVDEEAATHMATRHLIGQGHTRIGFIGGTAQLSTGEHRAAGFRRAMREAGIDVSAAQLALGAPKASFGRAALIQFQKLKDPPTAVIAAGYELTLGSIQCAHDLRIRIPDDMSFIGYGSERWASLVGLTMISLPVEDMAVALSDLLQRQILSDSGAPLEMPPLPPMVFVPHLQIRESTSEPAVKGKLRPRRQKRTMLINSSV